MKQFILTISALALLQQAFPEERQQIQNQLQRNNFRNQILNLAGRRNLNQIRGVNFQPQNSQAIHQPFVEPMTARKIRSAIQDAVHFLRSKQQPDGSISTHSNQDYKIGATALAALSMLAAGAHPASDDDLRRCLNWLMSRDSNNTYVRGIRANVWEYALRKVPYDVKIKGALKADYDWLMKAFKNNGRAWRYRLNSRDWDNSCSQYGVLGIWAAQRAGFNPGEAFWKKISDHFIKAQNADGGWGYTKSSSTANMATAGLASMFLVFDMHHGRTFYSRKNPRTFTEGDAGKVLKTIDRGMEWLGKHGGNNNDAYYFYGIERTGVASGRKYIGGRDWFKEGALTVLKTQDSTGGIRLGRWGDEIAQTSFCTLFLIYGGAPVAFNKLEYGNTQDWNLNPRDLANLTKHLWSAYERPLNWHSVSINAPASEFEAPILFISGNKKPKHGSTGIKKLREYIERGGTILAEPSDYSEEFEAGMKELLREMFPEKDYPQVKLEPLPKDHGLYTVLKQNWNKRPQLLGASDGSRTFFFLSKDYMSADWQMNMGTSDGFKLGMNLLFYSTDLQNLQGKYVSAIPDTPAAKPREGIAKVSRVRFTSDQNSPTDWSAGSRNWDELAPWIAHVTGYGMKMDGAVTLGNSDLSGNHLLHLTGRTSFHFSPKEKEALKEYVNSGGTVLVDSYSGSKEFTDSARKEIESIFGTLKPLEDSSILATGRFLGGSDLSRGIRYTLPARQKLRDEGRSSRGQHLEMILDGKRPAVIFSPFDLTGAIAGISNYRASGYKADSARRIVGNLVAYIMAE